MSKHGYIHREIAEWAYVGLVGFVLLAASLTTALASPRTDDLGRRQRTPSPVACHVPEAKKHVRGVAACESNSPIDWWSYVGLTWAGPNAYPPTAPPWRDPSPRFAE